MTELRETMRELRVSQPTRADITVDPPRVWVRLAWEDLGSLVGWGAAYCHPNDTFDRALGIEIAHGRAVKDAAQTLLEMAREPEWTPSEQGGEEMGPGYKCFQCEHFEPSRRNPELGLCHEACVFLQYPHMPACGAFRLREEEPPEDAGDGAGDGGAPGLEERVQALVSKVMDLTDKVDAMDTLASLVQNMHLDALPAVYRRLGTLEACERLDEKRLTRLEQGRDVARREIMSLEMAVERLEARPGDNAA